MQGCLILISWPWISSTGSEIAVPHMEASQPRSQLWRRWIGQPPMRRRRDGASSLKIPLRQIDEMLLFLTRLNDFVGDNTSEKKKVDLTVAQRSRGKEVDNANIRLLPLFWVRCSAPTTVTDKIVNPLTWSTRQKPNLKTSQCMCATDTRLSSRWFWRSLLSGHTGFTSDLMVQCTRCEALTVDGDWG